MTKLHASPDDLRRLVAKPWWEWVPGMLVCWPVGSFDPIRIVEVDGDLGDGWITGAGGRAYRFETVQADGHVPIPHDPATAGCLLGLYLRGSNQDLALMGLSATRPDPDEYASFGDFLVAALLAG